MVSFKCVKCGEVLEVPDSLVGQIETCPSCGNIAVVTAPAARVMPPPAAIPVAAPVQVHARGLKGTSGLGIAALVLGILACLTCWIPFLGLLSLPLSILGCLFAGIGFLISLVGRKSGVGMPVAGAIVCGVAIFVAVSMTGGAAQAISDNAKERHATNQRVPTSPVSAGDKLVPMSPVSETGSPVAKPSPSGSEQEWASADKPVRQGDIQVKVLSAGIARVPLSSPTPDSGRMSENDLLMITLEISNLSQTAKLNYRGWTGSDFGIGRDYGTLVDNFENTYKRITFGIFHRPKGQVESESVYPGKTITDLLVFEQPIDKADCVKLELPAENFGGTGMLRIRIPISMVKR